MYVCMYTITAKVLNVLCVAMYIALVSILRRVGQHYQLAASQRSICRRPRGRKRGTRPHTARGGVGRGRSSGEQCLCLQRPSGDSGRDERQRSGWHDVQQHACKRPRCCYLSSPLYCAVLMSSRPYKGNKWPFY